LNELKERVQQNLPENEIEIDQVLQKQRMVPKFGMVSPQKHSKNNIHRPLTIKRKKVKKKNLVFFGHQSWNLVLNMMLGLQKAIKSCSDPGTNILSKRDFKVKYIFDLIPRRTGS